MKPMLEFTVAGQSTDLLLVVKKSDYPKMFHKDANATIKAVKVCLSEKTISEPEIVDKWLKFVPFEPVSLEHQELVGKIIRRKLPSSVIIKLNETIQSMYNEKE